MRSVKVGEGAILCAIQEHQQESLQVAALLLERQQSLVSVAVQEEEGEEVQELELEVVAQGVQLDRLALQIQQQLLLLRKARSLQVLSH